MGDVDQVDQQGVGIYVHLPFCARHCYYCDFPVQAGRRAPARDRYLRLLIGEMEQWAAWWRGEPRVCRQLTDLGLPTFPGRPDCPPAATEPLAMSRRHPEVTSIYLGGGTPTLYRGPELAFLLNRVRELFPVRAQVEVTVEANPDTITIPLLEQLVGAGVTRISLGAQANRDDLLQALGRGHTVAVTERAVALIRQARVDSLNLDLMFALPGQSLEEWDQTLRWAISLGPDHLSCYSLILEEGTPLARWVAAGRRPPLPSESEQLAQYQCARRRLQQAGYRQYEISNFARPGHESRHNLLYWQYGDWLACGLGAAAHWGKHRWRNTADLAAYEAALSAGQPALAEVRPLTAEEQIVEWTMMGLRQLDGVDPRRFQEYFGLTLAQAWAQSLPALLEEGFLAWTAAGRLRLTERGLPVANAVLAQLLLG